MATRRNRNQRNRKSRRGGHQDLALNQRNCKLYWHPYPSKKCDEAYPGSTFPRSQLVNYPGFLKSGIGRQTPTFRMQSYPFMPGQPADKEFW